MPKTKSVYYSYYILRKCQDELPENFDIFANNIFKSNYIWKDLIFENPNGRKKIKKEKKNQKEKVNFTFFNERKNFLLYLWCILRFLYEKRIVSFKVNTNSIDDIGVIIILNQPIVNFVHKTFIKYGYKCNINSFNRQLNMYGFAVCKNNIDNIITWKHDTNYFDLNNPFLLPNIKRKNPTKLSNITSEIEKNISFILDDMQCLKNKMKTLEKQNEFLVKENKNNSKKILELKKSLNEFNKINTLQECKTYEDYLENYTKLFLN